MGLLTIAVFLVLWPLAIIWALNMLFALGIAYGFWQWLAVAVLVCTVSSAKFSKS